jgi:GT2 family glycosyltransferase
MVVRVSVVILNLNGDVFLKKLMISISKQTFRDFEVVFVDNGSHDNSVWNLLKMLKEPPFQDFRVKVVLNHNNLGFPGGNNVGLINSHGKYVVFLNSDTYVAADWLGNLVRILDNDNSVGACQSAIIFAQSKMVQTIGNLLDIYGWSTGISEEPKIDVLTNGFFYPSGASVIVRRGVLKDYEGFDELILAGDYDLGWRIRLMGYKIYTSIKSKCYHYSSYSIQMTRTRPELFYEACKERIYVLCKNYSLRTVAFRLPISLMLMLTASVLWCFETRKDFLTPTAKAIIWNLKNIDKLETNRRQIQRVRKIPDSEIDKFMVRTPLMIHLARAQKA